jgi:hypothetical protein
VVSAAKEEATKEHIAKVAVEVLSPRILQCDVCYLESDERKFSLLFCNRNLLTICETSDRILCLVESPVDQIEIVVGVSQ